MTEKDSCIKLKEVSFSKDYKSLEGSNFYLILYHKNDGRLLRWKLDDFDFPLIELWAAERVSKQRTAETSAVNKIKNKLFWETPDRWELFFLTDTKVIIESEE